MLSEKLQAVLRKARLRLASPKRWLQGNLTAENDEGETAYCLYGSFKVGNKLGYKEEQQIAAVVLDSIHKCGYRYDAVADFNDCSSRQHRTVLRVLDHALENN
jgi:hypothetical protein